MNQKLTQKSFKSSKTSQENARVLQKYIIDGFLTLLTPCMFTNNRKGTVTKENKFVVIIRTCLLEELLSYLIHSNCAVNSAINSDCIDLYNLLLCNKDLNRLLTKKFIQNIKIPLSVIKKWNNEKLSWVKKIVVDGKYSDSWFNFSYDENFSTDDLIRLNKKGSLSNLKEMTFSFSFNEPIKKEMFPKHLDKIIFDGRFNKPIAENVLPNGLTELVFDFRFNQNLVEGSLPENLSKLKFSSEFNQSIAEKVLPKKLTSLTFGYEFNQLLMKDVLPEKLTSLRFDYKFNQMLYPNVLPE